MRHQPTGSHKTQHIYGSFMYIHLESRTTTGAVLHFIRIDILVILTNNTTVVENEPIARRCL